MDPATPGPARLTDPARSTQLSSHPHQRPPSGIDGATELRLATDGFVQGGAMTRFALRSLFVTLALALCLGATYQTAAALTTIRVASDLNRPIYCTAPPGDSRLFIIEQRGVIKILQNGVVLPLPFLDIDALIPNVTGNDERGLLGLAFHPNYAQNGFFYVNYINLGSDTIIARFHVSADPNRADSLSAQQVMFIDQPFTNHNGGHLAFGPDNYLYIGMGDGGSAGDPQGNGQRDDTMLGKMLRIDINGDDFPADPNRNYAIPPTNPFVGAGNPLDEIWSKGLRNPYRWSFDRLTGDLYIADVGQGCWEEINFQAGGVAGGQNYGWVIMEGLHCYIPAQGCNPSCTPQHILPIHEYSHSEAGFSCSVTGGYSYRGSIPSIQGRYFFADFCSNQIYSFRYTGGAVTELTNRTAELAPGGGLSITGIAGFGEDANGELYIVDRDAGTTGEVYKVVDPTSGVDPVPAPQARFEVSPATPNPFTDAIDFDIHTAAAGVMKVEVFDAAGRLVRTLAENTSIPSGTRNLVWNGQMDAGQAAPSGIYFLRVEVNGEALSQRITLVR
jgi:glucose/arabinose dehydrogenase